MAKGLKVGEGGAQGEPTIIKMKLYHQLAKASPWDFTLLSLPHY